MYRSLENYLAEISCYLVSKNDKEDILKEIEAHIIERAESEHGEINEEVIKDTINIYGKPREVAKRYLEDFQLIAPEFKNYLFLYTSIVFSIHLGIYIACITTINHFNWFPFLFNVKEDYANMLFYLPTAFIFDFGLISIILYLITQKYKHIKLPWFRSFNNRAPKKVNLTLLIILAGLFICTLFLFLKFQSVFIIVIGGFAEKGSVHIVKNNASTIGSILVLICIGLAIVYVLLKIIGTSVYMNVFIGVIQLSVLRSLIQFPTVENLISISDLKLRYLATCDIKGIITFFIFLATYKLIKDIIYICLKHFNKHIII